MRQTTRDMMWMGTGCLLAIAGATGVAVAGPLNRARVDHDASWVVHIDMERLRESPVGCGMLTERASFPASMFHDLHTDLGIDPATDINSITLYGLPESRTENAAVISATSAADQIPQFLRDGHADNFEEIRAGGNTLLSWKVEDSRWYLCVRTPAADTDRVLVISNSPERVNSALEVLDGSRRNLTWTGEVADQAITDQQEVHAQPKARPWPFDQEPAKGSMVFLVAGKSMWQEKQPASEPLRGTRGVVLDIAEQKDESGVRWTSISGHMRMEDEKAADQMVKVGQGVISWLNLMAQKQDPPENCCRTLENAAPVREGTDVTLSVKIDSNDLAGVLRLRDPDHNTNNLAESHKARTKPENRDTPAVIPANNPVSEKGIKR